MNRRRTIRASLLVVLATGFCLQPSAQEKKDRPNILLILADDLGWADLGCYGSSFYETPNLDRMARQGTRFTHGYAASPVCSPTRASLMTGKNPVATGVTDWIRGRQENGLAKPYEKLLGPPTAWQLSLQEETIAEYAQSNGYATFFAGKWHLGEEEKFWPQYQGFSINKGGWSKGSPTGRVNDSTGGFFTPYRNPLLADGPPGEYLTDRLTNECLSFMESNRQQPFFMLYSLYAVHNPLQAPKELVKKYQEKRKQAGLTDKDRFAKDEDWMRNENEWKRRLVQDNPVYAAMIENMDWNIGRLLEKLEALNIAENTLVIFTSDNGGLSTAEGSPTANGPFRAGKGWLYEGGTRVPLIFYWKNRLQAGRVTDLPVITQDIYPTLAGLIHKNYQKPAAVEGEDIFSMLSRYKKFRNRALYWHYPHYSNQGGTPGSVVRQGKYKLIRHYATGKTELFDLVNDPSEKQDLSGEKRKIARWLNSNLEAWLLANKAEMPAPNPGYNHPAN